MNVCIFPPQDVQVRLSGSGHRLKASLAWKPPRRNADSVGGYLVERTVWWHGTEPVRERLTRRPVKALSFVDHRVVPDAINEYRVLSVHRTVSGVPPVPSCAAPVYGFAYVRYREMVAELKRIAAANPDICRLVDAGRASGKGYRIWCMVLGEDLADHPDRPGVMLAGNVHGGEVQSADALLGVIREAAGKYRANDPDVRGILKSVQTRIIPMYNPHGRETIENGGAWGRKTHPPRMLPPALDPLERARCWTADYSRGLDPNRTFDAEWSNQGDYGNPRSGVYVGKRPFAAPETQALVKMAHALRPQISVHYHGPCGASLYPGKWQDGQEPPDHNLIVDIAAGFAARSASEFSGEIAGESPIPSSTPGVAIRWFYRAFYGAHLCPEGFHEQLVANRGLPAVTDTTSLNELIPNNFKAWLWLARRVCGAGIEVRVCDTAGHPVRASVEVVGHMDPHCLPQHTDVKHGSYRRLLAPGVYTVRVGGAGFQERVIGNLRVVGGKTRRVRVVLELPRSSRSRNVRLPP